jgi:hypothetical protein
MITAAILFLAKPLARATGWDVTKAQRLVWAAVILVALVAVAAVFNRACDWLGSARVTTPQEVQDINDANEAKRDQQLTATVERHADAVTTVDGRNTISDVNTVERNAAVDAKVEQIKAGIDRVHREKGRDITQEELECMLTGNDCPQQ